MTLTIGERLINKISTRRRSTEASRRGFLGGAAVVGAAIAVDPWGYLVRPANAYEAVCGDHAGCADGYSVFCCTINGGSNTCPPDSFIGGWWKADNSSFCGGSARYYIDCNAFVGGPWRCRCAEGTCDQRRVACNQFRYGQCSPNVSAAQTGPVVCRMVSCTPPWQQFSGVCTDTNAVDARTATHSAPCLTGRPPIGSLDGIGDTGGALRIRGWAFDPDQPGTEIPVAIYADGAGIGWFPTGVPRSDVNGALGVPGNHGFDISIPMNPGAHSVSVYAINVAGGTGNPLLGTRSVSVGVTPLGFLDSVTPLTNGVRIKGWAFDPDQPSAAINVAVYRNGLGVGWFLTGQPRPDVNSAFGIGGAHGFDLMFESPPGAQAVDVFAINVGGGVGNPLIGQGRTTVGAYPRGNVDQLAVDRDTVRVRGWAYDPDQPGRAISVAVYRDGIGIDWFTTGTARPDVNSVFGITGNHGFDIPIPNNDPGVHTFAVYGINVGPEGGNPLLGTGSVRVTA